jgi:anti-sigma regulatory factor (Ser/Thr protein kinase)
MMKAPAYIATAIRMRATSTSPAVMIIRRSGRVSVDPRWPRRLRGRISSMTGDYPAGAPATLLRRVMGVRVVSWGSTWGNLASTLPGGHMADVANTNNGQSRSDRSVELRVAAKLENLAVLRTLVAAVGTFEDLDFDAVSDLRLAVDEACTRLIRSAVPDSTLLLVVEPREDAVVVDASTTCMSPDIVAPGSFSWHVLSSLTDEVRTFQNGHGPEEAQVFGISMTTRRASSPR